MTRAECLYREFIIMAEAHERIVAEEELSAENGRIQQILADTYRYAALRARIVLCVPITITGEKVTIGKP